jgi:AcrR family transcriptional regulator
VARRAADTRARLIAATTDVVRRVGYPRATTRAIAEAAGVAEGTIYRHFTHKHELFFAAVLERNAPIVEWVSQLPELAGTATVRDNIVELMRRLIGLREDLLPLEIALRADPELAREHQAIVAAMTEAAATGPPEFVATYLAAEQRLGRVRAGIDSRAAAFVILATVAGVALLPVHDQERGLDPVLIDVAADVIVDGLGPMSPA